MTRSETTAPFGEAMEQRMRSLRLVGPPPDLRERVLASAARPRPVPLSERVLPWAWAALVLVLAGGHWMERVTAERMARLAQSPATAPFVQEEQLARDASAAGAWALFPPAPMPIRTGYPSTRLHLRLSSLPHPWESPMNPKGTYHDYPLPL